MPSFLPLQGFLYQALGFTLAMGLEADKVELLLLELLYKTDYGNDFDREVKAPSVPSCPPAPSGLCGEGGLMRDCVSVCMHVCVPVHTWLSVHLCVCTGVCGPLLTSCPLPGWLAGSPLQGVIQCFGLCAHGQVKTVLKVLQDFEERIQESEQSWQISAWQVRLPLCTAESAGTLCLLGPGFL